ncbi:3-dehydroquinate synthase homolog isoform X2 [Oryza brachyantha]|uniref:3-dehydroquinate synthase homolog isoform X2 n=1 Tax=Oryza brachyantha TaxID=4533 RepID=UPI0003EAC1E5|nr:3-dehydroquinate synthase homolog isoform X2 [Oryza brachyantha]
MAAVSSWGFARALASSHASCFILPHPRTALASACSHSIKMCASPASTSEAKKTIWVWTTNRQVMTAAVERGWSTFLFGSKDLGKDWSSTARINPLFIDGLEIFDEEKQKVAVISEVSSPRELELIQPDNVEVQNIVIDFRGGWQVIPAENIVAAFQGCRGTVLAVSTNATEAQVFLEALEQGLDGVVLKVEDMDDIIKLKDYFDRRNEAKSQLLLTKATVSKVEVVGMGDRVCVDLCSMMRPGEGLLVGSYARGMFLVHSECLETNYIASRPFRVNAGPVHAYVAVPGGRTSYLSELQSGREVIVVDQNGLWRTAIVGRVKIESRPLILVEAKDNCGADTYSIFLQNAETVALVPPEKGSNGRTAIPVTSLKVGDEVLVRKQGGARHTGIEIQEFIVEK